jgi:hypothetical protein
MDDQVVYYRTSDSSLASYLITQGYRVAFIDYAQPRVEAAFVLADGIKEKATDYMAGLGRVEPNAYGTIYKKLSRIIKQGIQFDEDD